MMTAVGMESRAYSEALTVEAAELSESADVRGEMSCSKLTKFLKDIHILTLCTYEYVMLHGTEELRLLTCGMKRVSYGSIHYPDGPRGSYV